MEQPSGGLPPIKPLPNTSVSRSTRALLSRVAPIRGKQKKILDFDIENRPWSYWYDGRTTDLPIAIAWSWVGEDVIHHGGLTWDDFRSRDELLDALNWMMRDFLYDYDRADVVTGHYIRRHDLPILNGLCFRLGLPSLEPKLTIDTKNDMPKVGGVSLSQENLAYLLRLDEKKHHMGVSEWEDAFILSEEGFEETKKRVTSDVEQHKSLHQALKPYLKAPRVWKP